MTPPDRHGEIAERAYRIWEGEGRPGGRDLDHWLRAEAEVHAEAAEKPLDAPIKAERAQAASTTPAARTQRSPPRGAGRTQ
jgi:hypothetical protein